MAQLTGSHAPLGHLLPATAHMSPCDNTALLIHTTTSASVLHTMMCGCVYVCVCVYVCAGVVVCVYTAIL